MAGPTWRDLYHDEVAKQRGVIRRARELGQTWLRFRGCTFDPTRTSDREADRLARREAESILNYTINSENERLRRAGRPLEVEVDEV